MKILLISRPFMNSNEGTGEQAVARRVYTSLAATHSVEYVKQFAIPPYHNFISLLFYDYIIVFLKLLKCQFIKYDVVIFTSPYQSVFARWFSFKSFTSCIVHDLFFLDYGAKSFFDKYSKMIFSKCLRHCQKILVTTNEIADELQSNFGYSSTICLLGIDYEPYQRKSTQISNKALYIGSYTERKRPEVLISFAESCIEYKTSFHVAGRISDLIRSKFPANEYIKVLGDIDENKKISLFKDNTFLFFPTSLEGFGMPLSEAMRFSVVPIVLRDAKIPSVIKDRCIIVANYEDALTTIAEMVKNKQNTSKFLQTNLNFSMSFNWNEYANALLP